jgi:transposase
MADLASKIGTGRGVTPSGADLNSNLTITIDADEVTAALDKLDSRQSGEALKKAIRVAVKYLKPKVKAEAPKGKTGNLRKKVGYKVKKSRKENGYYGAVRSFARHHHLVVAGTQARFTKAGAFRGRMPANGYVDRAADAHERTALDLAEAELVRQLGLE